MRQEKNNITYIGNCFSHDFSDSNDWHNKGFAILDTETNDINYYEWEDAPKYCSTFVSQMANIEFGSNMILKLMNDTTLTQVDLNKFDDELRKIPQIKDVLIYPAEMSIENGEVQTDIKNIDNIDTIIEELISNMDMENVSNNKLIEIYRDLEIK
jgi:DNA-binding Lrp family transcriptional regulator